jgi:hypothetical protein
MKFLRANADTLSTSKLAPQSVSIVTIPMKYNLFYTFNFF